MLPQPVSGTIMAIKAKAINSRKRVMVYPSDNGLMPFPLVSPATNVLDGVAGEERRCLLNRLFAIFSCERVRWL